MKLLLAFALFAFMPRQALAGAETWEILAPQAIQFDVTTTGKVIPAVDLSAVGARDLAFSVKGSTGSPTSWSVNLEASVDNSSWTVVGTHATADGDGIMKWAAGKPALYYRFNVIALTLGSSASKIVLTFLGIR